MNYISEQPMRRGFYTPPLSPTQMASEFENQISWGGGEWFSEFGIDQ